MGAGKRAAGVGYAGEARYGNSMIRALPHRFGLLFSIFSMVAGVQPVLSGALIREVRIGVLAHDVPGLWSGFRLETTAPDLNAEVIFTPSLSFFGGVIRPAVGGTWNTNGGTSKAYLDARWQFEAQNGVFFGVGIGVAVHDGVRDISSPDHKALGARALLHFPLEIGYRFDRHHSVSLYFEHFSNGYTNRYNEGIDGLGARYGYKF
ncbi:MAG TPA: acyloxyacyl hydrolase [Hyphomicrobiaceae bacterium]|nr:acyloxyacyl hydrolase [Hyphomicrobiaceae bacterium]